ncbi:DnaJ domain-containing protein [Cryptosporidium muris RN66]|uniref:DnaJ domain-containing protein n=1 Tax=Cryptosporidium muris (strain RN66) TaxID=441375 RepID=B6ADU7_CRYMR|nr:DnaJ domain-containing protein [Cryptosporidium muris RN66]EEA06388.1 DnaJ domain-containing protein [Cryptosporidium muris RN66]|eukprot:XP_002140737.1 DnaJ domain-containing protein [Cryptosporidium muris RN66]
MVKDTRLYEIIGVSPDATAAEIKREYRIRALALHPDKNRCDETSKERFQNLQKAYEVLRDEQSRAEYDESGYIEDDYNDNSSKWNNLTKFFKQFTKKVTIQDILEYKKIYRGSNDEWEDICYLYNKFDGDCTNLLEYIPFCEAEDIDYYIDIIRKAIKDQLLPKRDKFDSSINKIRQKTKKWKKQRVREEKQANIGNMDNLVLAIKGNMMKRNKRLTQIFAQYEENSNDDNIDEAKFQEIQKNILKKPKRI